MFTGLITDLGTITHVQRTADGCTLTISPSRTDFPLSLGASIACDGVCLTVADINRGSFTAHLSAETLRVTTAQHWNTGDVLNLEPSLKLGDALGGHLVSGHVDGVGKVISVTPQGESEHWVFEAPCALMPLIAVKGSITINGISLTVNAVSGSEDSTSERAHSTVSTRQHGGFETKEKSTFAVTIIPHTRAHTNLQHKKPGDGVNLEIDLLARYVARILEARAA